MTSNIASEHIQDLAEKQAEQWEIEARIKDALKQVFRPEFLNRIDEIIVFHQLDKESLARIVDIQVRELSKRLAGRKITLDLDDEARKLIAEFGWDEAYGARPLKRVIQQKIENELAQRILRGQIADGAHVTVTVKGKGFAFEVKNSG